VTGRHIVRSRPETLLNFLAKNLLCLKHPNEWHSVMFGKYRRAISATGAPQHALLESDD